MRKLIKFGIGIAVVLVVVGGVLSYHNNKLYQESFMGDYNYENMLETDSSLKKLTLYIPLPLFNE